MRLQLRDPFDRLLLTQAYAEGVLLGYREAGGLLQQLSDPRRLIMCSACYSCLPALAL